MSEEVDELDEETADEVLEDPVYSIAERLSKLDDDDESDELFSFSEFGAFVRQFSGRIPESSRPVLDELLSEALRAYVWHRVMTYL
jgi:hypothetical protein